jgi:hypothetical protein
MNFIHDVPKYLVRTIYLTRSGINSNRNLGVLLF